MTAPGGFLDFFILEASDYVEQLDAALLGAAAGGPDGEALQRTARALRGSAQMAKLAPFAEVAAGIERVGRALRERALPWEPGLRGVLVAAVDDCKIFLHNVRGWSAAEDARARARADELARYAPLRAAATPLASPSVAGHDEYLATESANIGAGLELLVTRPSDRDAAGNVLRRVRALRGIASVKDHASLADVLQGAEQAAQPLELGQPVLSAERVAVLSAAAAVLRGAAAAMRAGTPVDASGAELAAFAAALDQLEERETGGERVVPISQLFYDDGGATVVETAPNPPTTPGERFRLEVVSQGEHLQRLVADAHGVRDELARERVKRGLRGALRSLGQAAESFGERDVAEFVASHNEAVIRLDGGALHSLQEVASLLAQPGASPAPIGERIQALKAHRSTAAMTPLSSPAQPPFATPAAERVAEPRVEPQERVGPAAAAVAAVAANAAPSASPSLGDLLDVGIGRLGSLAGSPLSAPVALAEQPPVPIDTLLYRGRSAIERCREIRDTVRTDGGPVNADTLAELFDLLDLALVD